VYWDWIQTIGAVTEPWDFLSSVGRYSSVVLLLIADPVSPPTFQQTVFTA